MKITYTPYIPCLFLFIFFWNSLKAQPLKVLFNASKAETANNADWVVDADLHNLGYTPNPAAGAGTEANAQQIPMPPQSGITSSTPENYWTGAISSWGVELAKRGYIIESLPITGTISYGNASNPQDLSNYKLYVLDEPNIKFTNIEKTAIIQFVSNGGGLFLISDHNNADRNNDGWDALKILNDLMTTNPIQTNPFGFSFEKLLLLRLGWPTYPG